MACTNLAVLYMMNENYDIAHEAFKAAQSTDPNYQQCWIGHAIYAEMIAHQETMDLFRHSVTLGKHVSSFPINLLLLHKCIYFTKKSLNFLERGSDWLW